MTKGGEENENKKKRETKKNKMCKRYKREKTERQSKIRTKKGENSEEKKKLKQKMLHTENNEKKDKYFGWTSVGHGTWSIACDLPHVLRGNLLVAVSNVHSCPPNLFEFVELTFSC